jgi:hypothetical protein
MSTLATFQILLNSETARLRNDETLMMFGGTCYGGHFGATVRNVAQEAPKTGKEKKRVLLYPTFAVSREE